jgi:hypothetical protein
MRFLLTMVLIFFATISTAVEKPNGYAGEKECNMCHKFIKKTGYLNSTHGNIFTNNPRGEQEALGCRETTK